MRRVTVSGPVSVGRRRRAHRRALRAICSATTIRSRRDEWIRLGVFARLKQLALESYDRIVGVVLD